MSPRRRGRGRGVDGSAVAAAPVVSTAPRHDAEGAVPVEPVGAEPHPPLATGPAQAPVRLEGGGLAAQFRRQPKPRIDPSTDGEDAAPGQRASCTLAQMRRFIKSRPYVPVHELRRRFLIEGMEDEVSPMSTGQRTLFVGLPEREAGFLGELVKGGEVGCELLLDPTSPAVVGVFPMRPVARQ
jgi:hypothetical protein